MRLPLPTVLACIVLLTPLRGLAAGGVEEHVAEPVDAEMGAALALEPRPAHGARLAKQCAACHGTSAQGSRDGTVPALAAQHYRYLVKQIVDFRDEQRFVGPVHDGVARAALKGPQDIADLAGYLAELPPNERPRTGSGKLAERGAALYRNACQSCHGVAAVGNERLGIPSLHGQHHPYLVRQIGDLRRDHRFNAPPDLTLLLSGMPQEDVEALADYLSRLPFEGSIVTRLAPHPGERALSAGR